MEKNSVMVANKVFKERRYDIHVARKIYFKQKLLVLHNSLIESYIKYMLFMMR